MQWWKSISDAARRAAFGQESPEAVIHQIRDRLEFDAAMLVLAKTDRPTEFRAVVNLDYAPEVVDFVVTDYAVNCPGHKVATRRATATRFIDLGFDFRDTRTYQEALKPSGFGEGVTVPFTIERSRTLGFLAMSSTHSRSLSDASCLGLTLLAAELGSMCEPDAVVPRATEPAEVVLRVTADGRVLDVRGDAPVPTTPAQLRRIAAAVGSRYEVGLRHRDDRNTWWRIHAYRVRDAVDREVVVVRCTVERPPGGLTARELDVAGLASFGLTNGEIATALRVSARTAKAHLESALAKMGCDNRTELSRRAVDDDLMSLPVIDLADTVRGGRAPRPHTGGVVAAEMAAS